MISRKRNLFLLFWSAIATVLLVSAHVSAQSPVKRTTDGLATRLRVGRTFEQLQRLTEAEIQAELSAEDRDVLATRYWCFDANVPVVVSIMRDTAQEAPPFWLAERGFRKTDLRVRNEEYEYEVWQKPFAAGRIGLGINGFDKHRPHYFVCVGPQRSGEKVTLSHFAPEDQAVIEMRKGAFIYHDWPDLILTQVPADLEGEWLLPTYRGRAREAHLREAFRATPFPSGAAPDHTVLTWSGDPRTSQTIQWRTDATVERGVLRYREQNAGGAAWREVPAEHVAFEDLLIVNDPRIHVFTGVLDGLLPATRYAYQAGDPTGDRWSDPSEFVTAPETPAPFSFVFMSDTHNAPFAGQLLAAAVERDPNAAFCAITGDLVGTGQYRDDWDQFFEHVVAFASRRPLVPVLGNHDTIDGLGCDLYRGVFTLPANGPSTLPSEQGYAFEYSNALFLVLDATASIEAQTSWIDERLRGSRATWKFALLHFPPYADDEDYPDIRREWCPLFDRYHVDFVLSGHVHYYLRTQPMKDGKVVASPAEGTIYMITVAVAGRNDEEPTPSYAAKADFSGVPLYQWFSIDGNRLVSRSYDIEGSIRDEIVIGK